MTASRETIATIRFGYGFRPGEPAPDSAAALLASLAPGAAFPIRSGPTIAERVGAFAQFNDLRRANRNNANRPEMDRIQNVIRTLFFADIRERLLTPVLSPHGFFERLAWFWSGHFALGAKNLLGRTLAGRFEAEAIRPYLAGPFRLLLRAAVTHPAMLHFLDQDSAAGPNSPAGRSGKTGLNENLAREIIELHTLGVGANYSQADVRQFAELLTGLTFDRRTGAMAFRPRRAEPGAETVLGVSYGGGAARLTDIYLALDDLAAHPATARHIARKLAVHFVADTPTEALVEHLAAAFRRSDGNLRAVYGALLEHHESWARFGEKVKQPFDFLVSSLRAADPTPAEIERLRTPGDGPSAMIQAARRLDQAPLFPPGPQGWPEAAGSWITPQALTVRIDWASRLARGAAARTDPRDFVDLALSDAASPAVRFVAANAAERWEGLALVLASPEFNRR